MKTYPETPVQVSVAVQYLSEQSNEAASRYVFSYTVSVKNQGAQAVKLLRRHWRITDANDHLQEVKGKGVVGEQPIIPPGQTFEYSSGTVLATQVGVMSGSYQMLGDDGTEFEAPIPQFVLSIPRVLH